MSTLLYMDYPTPDDPKRAPVWQNYVIAQATQAALTIVPSYVHALGVRVDRFRVTLVVQAPESALVEDDLDIVGIRDELESLLGPDGHVVTEVVRSDVRRLDPHDDTCWFYAART